MELLAFELQSCMGLFIGRFDLRAWEVLIVALGGLDCRSWEVLIVEHSHREAWFGAQWELVAIVTYIHSSLAY